MCIASLNSNCTRRCLVAKDSLNLLPLDVSIIVVAEGPSVGRHALARVGPAVLPGGFPTSRKPRLRMVWIWAQQGRHEAASVRRPPVARLGLDDGDRSVGGDAWRLDPGTALELPGGRLLSPHGGN